MSDLLTSWLRTVVPGIWSALLAVLVAHVALPADVAAALGPIGEQLLVPVVLSLVYIGLRKLEPKLPDWAKRLLLGSAKQPAYAKTGA